jgi:hypothetical protein
MNGMSKFYYKALGIVQSSWALFQASVSWNDFPAWPYIQIKSGTGSVLSIMFWAYRFGFDIGILERTWDWGRVDNFDSADEVA